MARTKWTKRVKAARHGQSRRFGSSHKGSHLAKTYTGGGIDAATKICQDAFNARGGMCKGVNIAGVARDFGIPKSTLRKRAKGLVKGSGVLAGGGRKPKVLSLGE